ncbi:CheY-like chemotaxis protein [Bradyrhizobium ottawaense]|uniref:CheY-like chemotaxis protein n=2 Tax=Bradyrhizobium ottawaense TaxID=931866 RepID=A0ABV4FPU5_9BRAD
MHSLCAQVDRLENDNVVGFVPGTSLMRCAQASCRGSPDPNPHTQDAIMTPALSNGSSWPADVLIVEDDPIIAIDFEDRLLGFGVTGVRTVGSVTQALGAIAKRAPDFALLDVELIRETSFAVAARLAALKIPFVFVTGYGAEARIPPEFSGQPRLQKPCSSDALEAALKVRALD